MMSDLTQAAKSLRIDELLRYLSTGFVAIGVSYVCDEAGTMSLVALLGPVGLSVAAFVFGVLFYYTYRPLIQTLILYAVKDCLACKSGNVRTHLSKQYPTMSRYQAELFWYFVRNYKPKAFLSGMRNEASGIHLVYMSSVLCFLGTLYSLVFGTGTWLLLLVVGIVLGIAALVHDVHYEKLEMFFLLSYGEDELDEGAEKIGHKKSGRSD